MKKSIASTAVLLAATTVTVTASAWPVTQSVDPTTILDSHSVSCNNGSVHTENSYYRVFSLDTQITRGTLHSIQFGVEETSGGPQPLVVRLYALTGDFALANLVQLGDDITLSIPNENETLHTIDLEPLIAFDATSQLVVELLLPDGQTDGYLMYVGTNDAGETAPTYIRAPECGINEPTSMAAIGFPDVHLMLSLDVTGCGDGVVDPDEVCDDGDLTDTGTCSADCQTSFGDGGGGAGGAGGAGGVPAATAGADAGGADNGGASAGAAGAGGEAGAPEGGEAGLFILPATGGLPSHPGGSAGAYATTGGISSTGGTPSTAGAAPTGGDAPSGGSIPTEGGAETATGGSQGGLPTGGGVSSAGDGGVAGTTATGGSSATETGGRTTTTGGHATGGSADPGGAGQPGDDNRRSADDSSGCGCRAARGSGPAPAAWFAMLFAVALPLVRRRTRFSRLR